MPFRAPEAGFGLLALATTAAASKDFVWWLDQFGWPGMILVGLFFLALRCGRWVAPYAARLFESWIDLIQTLQDTQERITTRIETGEWKQTRGGSDDES